MAVRLLAIGLLLSLGCAAQGAQDEVVLKTPFFSRTICIGAGVLITTKLEVCGVQVLAQPTVEFMLDLDVNGKSVTLVPSDFDIKSVDRSVFERTTRTEVGLECKRDDFPFTLGVRYFTNPDLPYIRKTVVVRPLRKTTRTILRRVVIEDISLKPEFAVPAEDFIAFDQNSGKGIWFFVSSLHGMESSTRFGGLALTDEADHALDSAYETGPAVIGTALGGANALYQAFTDFLWRNYCAARNSKSLGSCVDVALDTRSARPLDTILTDFSKDCGTLRKEHPNQPLCLALDRPLQPRDVHLLNTVDMIRIDCSKAAFYDYRRARCRALRILPIGAVRFLPPPIAAGTLVEEARALIVASLADALPSAEPSSDAADYLDKARAFKEKFGRFLTVYQPILDCATAAEVDGEARLIGSSGFLFFYNFTDQPRKVLIPLDAPNLNLKGELKLSNWTSLDAGAPIRTVRPSDNVEVEIAPRSVMVVGVNVDSEPA